MLAKIFSLKIEKANIYYVLLKGTKCASRGRWKYRGVESCSNIGDEYTNL